ncbi:hypothetical protein CC1G_08238 [Coprinopsis cinerea okayama7|uniref:SnoaL-like domain-containing protein n=1 Tax=Coprinopsis cinerea (strain Okayama-7 / 130 / ATCC MYA-4618 / FGSC 9003) TaxID=240176 RepID=A8P7I9_COPC7|nr:hypothetical protein CC1G_08238 [Coprinopsis cinerea okayama7\|eukprot:XP_001839371.2 hypothetical protein CC1G_08238 [Coprinopsis cinerea okayama7\
MRLLLKSFISLTLAVFAAASPPGLNKPPGHPGPWPPTVCNPNASGPHLQAQQQAAMEDFTDILFNQRDVQAAYDRWVPGQYINHSPWAEQGRQWAIDFLSPYYANPEHRISNVTVIGGKGYGVIHFALQIPGATIPDVTVAIYRFQGTCIVEHWDAWMPMSPEATNPIAYF